MAFSDNPWIDKSSINSEKSELNVKMLMSQESGFLLRADVPIKDVTLMQNSW